jgi:hypothetical protein
MQNLGCKNLPYFRSLLSLLLQNLLCPPTARADIVLPDFARSCSADGEFKAQSYQMNPKKSERWADRKAAHEHDYTSIEPSANFASEHLSYHGFSPLRNYSTIEHLIGEFILFLLPV